MTGPSTRRYPAQPASVQAETTSTPGQPPAEAGSSERRTNRRTDMEAEVRRVVSEVLGVAPTDLAPAVSLVDDLAADSLDIVEIGLGLEATVGVSMPDEVLAGIRTYGDVLKAVRRAPMEQGTFVRASIAPANEPNAVLERAGWLTPYLTETIAEDARRAGPGARLDVRVISTAANGLVAALERALGRVRASGAAVSLKHAWSDRRTAETTESGDTTDDRTCTM